ncbi:helix-turn-helix domain-containing protein [Nonomuraea phyllanthi]|uniref:helix-turn-helix transcriptional regulator n=1 Tax=Nonomuraea phyllanthi TaxID=2219224 RepID=UPI001292D79B|nr:helix-turn-helix transcriptional regulator [Nonomuraea phyllanthi]QFY13548.1 helix-turn-helix domain-containing protein [Nonomuraea phyllanthi]
MEAPELPLPDLLKYLRDAAGMTQQQLADELCALTGTFTLTRHEVGRWEQGRVRPRAWLPALASLLDVDLETLRRAPGRRPSGAPDADPCNDVEQVSEVLRRTLLRKGIAAVSIPVIGLHRDHRVIQALDAIADDHVGGVMDSIGELIDHYALTICALPPADVYDELLAVRSYANSILDRAGSMSSRTDLTLATGRLSHLLAVAACDMGEHATARVWCSDAERRSRDVNHPELAAWSALTRAMIAWYQGQPRQSATLSAKGQHSAPEGTVVYAKLASQEMRAAAMAGDVDRMTRARHRAGRAIAALPSDTPITGAFSIALAEDPPYTATSLVFLGRCQEAVAATNRVIQTVYQPEARQRGEHPSGYARALLILALAEAGPGRLDESLTAGHAALTGSRPAWPTMVLAGQLDRVLTRDFPDARETADYHARYLEVAGVPAERRSQTPGPEGSHT